jgi:hypothetical protein
MASGSTQYSGVNKARAGGYANQSGAAARGSRRTETVFQTTNPNAPNYSPF